MVSNNPWGFMEGVQGVQTGGRNRVPVCTSICVYNVELSLEMFHSLDEVLQGFCVRDPKIWGFREGFMGSKLAVEALCLYAWSYVFAMWNCLWRWSVALIKYSKDSVYVTLNSLKHLCFYLTFLLMLQKPWVLPHVQGSMPQMSFYSAVVNPGG